MNPLNDRKKIAIRYKTEICKNWKQGHCEFAEKCAFAHGDSDVHGKSLYRSKKCHHFFENGYCMFGTKCLFRHLSKNSLQSKHQPEKSRLPVFERICKLSQLIHPLN